MQLATRFDRSAVSLHVGSSRSATSKHGPVVNNSHRRDSHDCGRHSAQSQLVLAADSLSFRPQNS